MMNVKLFKYLLSKYPDAATIHFCTHSNEEYHLILTLEGVPKPEENEGPVTDVWIEIENP